MSTMTLDNVGLQKDLLGTSSFKVTLAIFSLDVITSGSERVQRPFTYFRGARDDFMVHDVDSPLIRAITSSYHLTISQVRSPKALQDSW